jgi:hypothetical protein
MLLLFVGWPAAVGVSVDVITYVRRYSLIRSGAGNVWHKLHEPTQNWPLKNFAVAAVKESDASGSDLCIISSRQQHFCHTNASNAR